MASVITVEQLTAIAGKSTPLFPSLVEWMNKTCPLYDIDTSQEYAHFLAQACHETDHFNTLCEYASGKAYEGRTDLGKPSLVMESSSKDGEFFRQQGAITTCSWVSKKGAGISLSISRRFLNSPNMLSGALASIGKHVVSTMQLTMPTAIF